MTTDKTSSVMHGRRHFRVDHVIAGRGSVATRWVVIDHEDAWEDIESCAERIAAEWNSEVDIWVAGERAGIRVGA